MFFLKRDEARGEGRTMASNLASRKFNWDII